MIKTLVWDVLSFKDLVGIVSHDVNRPQEISNVLHKRNKKYCWYRHIQMTFSSHEETHVIEFLISFSVHCSISLFSFAF
jgi:hypothetical protein